MHTLGSAESLSILSVPYERNNNPFQLRIMIDRLQRDSGLVFEEPSGFVFLLFSYGGSFFFSTSASSSSAATRLAYGLTTAAFEGKWTDKLKLNGESRHQVKGT